MHQGGDDDCVADLDVRRREVRGGLDTDLLQSVSGGLQVGYTLNDARHLSRRTSQISIIASFQLSLFAGDYPLVLHQAEARPRMRSRAIMAGQIGRRMPSPLVLIDFRS